MSTVEIKKMLNTIRTKQDLINESTINDAPDLYNLYENVEMNEIDCAKYLMERAVRIDEEATFTKDGGFPITKNTPQFGDVYVSQVETLKKTIGEDIDFGEEGLVFYPNTKDLVLNGKIKTMNIAFQFRYSDPSGVGCYLWANGFQMTDENTRTLGKIRDAFTNWKQSLIQNGDLIEKLSKIVDKNFD